MNAIIYEFFHPRPAFFSSTSRSLHSVPRKTFSFTLDFIPSIGYCRILGRYFQLTLDLLPIDSFLRRRAGRTRGLFKSLRHTSKRGQINGQLISQIKRLNDQCTPEDAIYLFIFFFTWNTSIVLGEKFILIACEGYRSLDGIFSWMCIIGESGVKRDDGE